MQGVEIVATVLVACSLITGLMKINLGNRLWQMACGLSALLAGELHTQTLRHTHRQSHTNRDKEAFSTVQLRQETVPNMADGMWPRVGPGIGILFGNYRYLPKNDSNYRYRYLLRA